MSLSLAPPTLSQSGRLIVSHLVSYAAMMMAVVGISLPAGVPEIQQLHQSERQGPKSRDGILFHAKANIDPSKGAPTFSVEARAKSADERAGEVEPQVLAGATCNLQRRDRLAISDPLFVASVLRQAISLPSAPPSSIRRPITENKKNTNLEAWRRQPSRNLTPGRLTALCRAACFRPTALRALLDSLGNLFCTA